MPLVRSIPHHQDQHFWRALLIAAHDLVAHSRCQYLVNRQIPYWSIQ
ncbi:Uncharacterised protein [Vibrio cholerae]|nr:Uncharacterised protein [Vibrio cholerae]